MRTTTRAGTALLLLAVAVAANGPAMAQAPTQTDRQPGVREILGRAEVEAARRTIGGILGSIAGPAQAQTAPPSEIGAATGTPPAPAPAISPGAAVAQTTTAAPAAPAAGGRGLSIGAPAVPAPLASGTGTPADPTMIVRVPDGGPAPAAAPVEPAAAPPPAAGVGAPESGAATTTAAGGPIARPSGATRIALPGVAASRRHGPGWCAPERW
jgi:hypothetical protein